MSNFASSDARQKKLKVSKPTPDEGIESFFEKIDRLEKRNTTSKVEPRGLLAYMQDSTHLFIQSHHEKQETVRKPPAGLERFSVPRKDVWDDMEEPPPRKASRCVAKGGGSISGLVDSGSNADIWDDFERRCPPSSTPHVKGARAKGPLDRYCKSNVGLNDSASDSSDIEMLDKPLTLPKQSEAPPKSARSNLFISAKSSRSVWDDLHPPSDDDVICIADSKPTRRPDKETKPDKKRHKKSKPSKPGQTLFQPSVAKQRFSVKTKTQSKSSCPMVVLDSD